MVEEGLREKKCSWLRLSTKRAIGSGRNNTSECFVKA